MSMKSFLTDKLMPIRNETLNSKSMNLRGSSTYGEKNFSGNRVIRGTVVLYKC